jgi:hypothetical protein
MSWAIIGASVVGAGAGIYGSQQAANASKEGSKNAQDLQRQMYWSSMGMLEPQRALGYGALSDIAGLYGYALPQYSTIGDLQGANGGSPVKLNRNATMQGGAGASSMQFTGPVTVDGRKATGTIAGINTNPFSNHNAARGAVIDPITGTVDITGMSKNKKEAKLEERATAYLRGEKDKFNGSKLRRIRNTIDEMREAGYEYDPNAQANAAAAPPTAGVIRDGQSGSMLERFQQMPGYQFGLSQGLQSVDRSAAARGGALSGNAVRASNQFGQDYAGTKFNEEFNRLMAMAGLGQVATGSAVNTGSNYAANAGNLMQQQGDARASGIMGTTNSVVNGINNGMSLWALQRGLNNNGGYQVPDDIRNFKYPFGP